MVVGGRYWKRRVQENATGDTETGSAGAAFASSGRVSHSSSRPPRCRRWPCRCQIRTGPYVPSDL